MSNNRLVFLKDAFRGFEMQFAEDYSNAMIINPDYDENITVYDDESEFIVCFSFQHRHFENEDDIIEWIRKIIYGDTFAIEFFNHGQPVFGGEIDADEMQDFTYENLERFTGYFGSVKLKAVADSFKIRGWDSANNFDYTITCEADGTIAINKTFVGRL